MRVASGGEASWAGSGFSRARARATLHVLAPRSRTRGKWRLMSWEGVGRSVSWACSTGREGKARGPQSYQEAFAKPGCYLVFEIVGLSAALGVERSALFLQPLGAAVEDLKDGSSSGLNGIGPARPGCSPGDLRSARS